MPAPTLASISTTRRRAASGTPSTPSRGCTGPALRAAIRDAGSNSRFDFNYTSDSRIWNTSDAHRLLHWAGLEGRQLELKEALFAANFTQQKSTSDHAVLIEAAKAAGLDGDKARDILA